MAKKTKKSAEKKVAQTAAPAVETVPATTPHSSWLSASSTAGTSTSRAWLPRTTSDAAARRPKARCATCTCSKPDTERLSPRTSTNASSSRLSGRVKTLSLLFPDCQTSNSHNDARIYLFHKTRQMEILCRQRY